jgi:hypothetical protein
MRGILSKRGPGGALSLEGKLFNLAFGQCAAFLSLHEVERLTACESLHLRESLDGHQGGQRLALPLDDELIVSQGDSIQHVSDSLADVDGRNSLRHSHLVQPF